MLSLMFLIINGYLIKCFVAPTNCIVFIVCLFEKIESLIELLMIKNAIIMNTKEVGSIQKAILLRLLFIIEIKSLS